MHRKTLMVLIFSLFVLPVALAPVFALDEAVLTPADTISGRPTKIIPAEDKEFNADMAVWFSHKYKEGEKKLKEFSQKYPYSRWITGETGSP
jgi:TolA-binding protein